MSLESSSTELPLVNEEAWEAGLELNELGVSLIGRLDVGVGVGELGFGRRRTAPIKFSGLILALPSSSSSSLKDSYSSFLSSCSTFSITWMC